MQSWSLTLRKYWDRAVSVAPSAALWLTRVLYFWGLVARSYLVRRGALRRGPAISRAPVPAAPAVRATARMPAAVAGHA
jgi:hypothetical protein